MNLRAHRLATLLLLTAGAVACSRQPPLRRIVLITIDSLRADHLDSGAGSRARTPALRRLAAAAQVFSHAYSPCPQTLPSHLAILSGRRPDELGVFGNDAVFDGRLPLLQETLKRHGWRTAAVVSLNTLAAASGIARGFDDFVSLHGANGHFSVAAEQVNEQALRLWRKGGDAPLFLWLHYSDPHTPYAPPGSGGRFRVQLDGRTLAEFSPYVGAILRLTCPLPAGRHRLTVSAEAPPPGIEEFTLRRLRLRGARPAGLENIRPAPGDGPDCWRLRGGQGEMVVRAGAGGQLSLFQIYPVLGKLAALEMYRREVEYLDGRLGELLRTLAADPHTAIVVTGDHGEGFGERNDYFGHVRYLNVPFIHVPLLLRLSGRNGRVDEPVSLTSIAATLLAAAAVRSPSFPAAACLPSAADGPKTEPPMICSATFLPAARADRFSLMRWPFQMIVTSDAAGLQTAREYYDLRLASVRLADALDPQVFRDTAPEAAAAFDRATPLWQGAFRRRRSGGRRPGAAHRQELRALGYL